MTSATVRSINPATLEVNAEVPAATPKDVEAAVALARKAQPEWAARSLEERAALLAAFARELLAEKVEVARLVTRETGKPVPEALVTDVFPALESVKFLRKDGIDILEDLVFRLSNPILLDRKSKIIHQPRGVIGIIGPWNYPFAIPVSQITFALLAGNAVVFKPATQTTLTGLKIKELLVRAGLPNDIVHVVPGPGGVVGDALTKSAIDYLIFTGSVPVGRTVQQHASARNLPTCMELGGSDPAIVLEDAHLDVAANGIAWARYANAGQTCAAAKRVFVVERVADAFTEKLVEKVKRLRVGNGLEPNVDVGPVIDARAVEQMQAFVDDAVQRGARVLTGGARVDDLPGHFFQPTVLADVPPDARVLREEVFGPVLPVVPVANAEEAVKRANDSPFGLSASVWTRDRQRAEAIARQLHAGTVTINDALYTFAAMETPWGGVKDSGHGRTHGVWGLLDMVELKHVNFAPAGRKLPQLWWYPYEEEALSTWERSLDFLHGGAAGKARAGGLVAARLLRKKNL